MIMPGLSLPVANVASSVTYAFATSDLFAQSIVLLLLGGSVFAWTIMITKMREMRRANAGAAHFIAAYRREGHPLALFLQNRVFEGPLFLLYREVCKALGSELGARGEPADLFAARSSAAVHVRLTPRDIELARNIAERTTADATVNWEDDMGFLATVVAAAPFLGLLGTVWGVMDTFRTMAIHGSVMLATVAPGICGALLTTVVGLLVAIPSLIGYNLLTGQIRRLSNEMENFTDELTHDLDRHFAQST